MKKSFFWLGALFFFFHFMLSSAFAGDDFRKELELLKKRVEELERKLAEQEKVEVSAQAPEGILDEVGSIKEAIGNLQFYLGITGIVQGTINNDDNARALMRDGGDVIDGSYSVDLVIQAPVGENGNLWIYFEGGEGDNVTDELGVLGGVNADALGDNVSPEISTWGYEHSFNDGMVILTIGQLILGDEYGDTLADDGDEGHFECYYNYRLNDHLTISPMIQMATNPGGDDDADTVVIPGLRTQMDF